MGVIEPVPARLPTVQLPALYPQSLRELLLPAFTVLIVGFSYDVVTAYIFARRNPDGSLTTNNITVEKNGVKPPM